MRRGAKRSSAWEHFRKLTDKKVICEICKKEFSFSGNTSNIRDHLRRKHPAYLFGSSTQTTSELITSEDEPSISGTQRKEQLASTSSEAITIQTHSNIPSISKQRPRQMELFVTNKRTELTDSEKDTFDKYLVKMIAVDLQPLSIVENSGFVQFCKQL